MTERVKEIIGIITAIAGFIVGLLSGQWISNTYFEGAYAPMFITYLVVMGLFMTTWHVISKKIDQILMRLC